MFKEEEKSSFAYWFAHWCAYQMTALNCHAWKFKYLFHDIEKPWLELIWRDHKRVKEWHRAHNTHHIEYTGKRPKDYEAIVIDWECSPLTKDFRRNGAKNEAYKKLKLGICTKEEFKIIHQIIDKFGLKGLKYCGLN